MIRAFAALIAGSVVVGLALASVLPERGATDQPVAQATTYVPVYAAPRLYAEGPPPAEGLQCGRDLDCSALDKAHVKPDKVTRKHTESSTAKGETSSDTVTVKHADESSESTTSKQDAKGQKSTSRTTTSTR